MKLLIGGFIALVSSGSVGAEPLLEGRVRLSSGQPAVGVQVRLFDLADMSQTPQMYWTHQTDETEGTGKIQRANLDGSNIETLISGLDKPFGLALDVTGGKVYWTGQDKIQRAKIQRANLDGSNIEALVTAFPLGLALDLSGDKMYWTGGDKIQRANLDGSNIETLVTLITGLEALTSIVIAP
ncbi:MAG: hypothetical protein OXH81_27595 [Gemmatimonadetes bacterium]|nr:hypothetical protein [Gemmatimonadota bacterium]